MQCVDYRSRSREIQAGGPAFGAKVSQKVGLERPGEPTPHQPRVDPINIFGFHQFKLPTMFCRTIRPFMDKLVWKTSRSRHRQFESKNRSFSSTEAFIVLP